MSYADLALPRDLLASQSIFLTEARRALLFLPDNVHTEYLIMHELAIMYTNNWVVIVCRMIHKFFCYKIWLFQGNDCKLATKLVKVAAGNQPKKQGNFGIIDAHSFRFQPVF